METVYEQNENVLKKVKTIKKILEPPKNIVMELNISLEGLGN